MKDWGVDFDGQVLCYVNEELARGSKAIWDEENPDAPQAVLIPPTDKEQ